MRNIRILLVAAAASACAGVGVPARAASSCTPGVPLYCAVATADAAIDCTIGDETFSCDLVGAYGTAASTDTDLPGGLASRVDIEVGICNGPGVCDQRMETRSLGCAWDLGGRSCDASDTYTETVSDAVRGCVFIWLNLDVFSRAVVPVAGVGLASAGAYSLPSFTNCE